MSQEAKVYDFKGVGLQTENSPEAFPVREKDTPIGIATPVRLSKNSGTLFEMHTDIKKQVKDNFRNMIATNHGERIMLHDFGANLRPLAYELGSEAGDSESIARIAKTTKKYMPYVSLETFEPIRELSTDGSLTRVGVRVTFTVPSLGLPKQTIEALILSAG